MPPTKHMTGNVFAGYLLDAFFNLCGVMTDQSILLIGMMTEGIHTPFLPIVTLPWRTSGTSGTRPGASGRASCPRPAASSSSGPGRYSANQWTC